MASDRQMSDLLPSVGDVLSDPARYQYLCCFADPALQASRPLQAQFNVDLTALELLEELARTVSPDHFIAFIQNAQEA